jgi:LacI family transcriptional regulator
MSRPTIKDVAAAAGVSVATVNRVLAGSQAVRPATAKRVSAAATELGFYGLGAIQSRISGSRPRRRLGFLLQQPHRRWYRMMATELEIACAAHAEAEIEPVVEFLEDLSPQNISQRLDVLGDTCQAIGVVAAVHPLVTAAIERLKSSGVPVFALVSHLTTTGNLHYVGLDNWKVGRTAAWAMHRMCRAPGKLGILVGNHRYRCQEMNEAGFRSYFREHAPGFTLLEPLSTFETAAVAEEMTTRLLTDHPDLGGLYVAGGGISGAIAALRETGRGRSLISVGYELMDNTRAALLDETLTLVISIPLQKLADAAVIGMSRSIDSQNTSGVQTILLPFEIYTRENI